MEYYPTIRQLQYLDALFEHKSFSKAAEHCNVTQSTLSAGIKELETLLDQRLVDRSRKQISLTNFGLTVLSEARVILSHAHEIKAKAKALGAPLSGTVKLGIIPTIAPYLLPEILPALHEKFPDLNLQLTEDQSARIFEQLKLGSLDVILLAFPYETPGMEQTLLFEEPFYLACPKGQWQDHKNVSISALKDKELLLLEEGHCLRDHALAACKFRAKADVNTFNATSLPTLIQFVQHGYGITLLPAMTVKSGIIPPNIDILSFKKPAPTRQIGMAWRKNHPQEKEFKLLLEMIKKII